MVEGYGVYLTKRQLESVKDLSQDSPTRMIRNLLMVFFKPSILAVSSCFGSGENPALNRDILEACFSELIIIVIILIEFTIILTEYVKNKFPGKVARTHLVNAVNDKCANYRRKSERKERQSK